MADRKASVSPNDYDLSLASHLKGCDTVDDRTVQQTPEPLAVSSAIKPLNPPPNNKRLQELLSSFTEQMSMPCVASGDRYSSFGLIPKHLMDFSMTSTSNAIDLFVKDSTDSSIKNISSEAKSSGDVSEEQPAPGSSKTLNWERQAGDGKEELSVKINSKNQQELIEKSAVEFCDEQISARSSTADDYRGSVGDRVSAVGNELFSKLFRRYSLDLVAVASSPVDNFGPEVGSKVVDVDDAASERSARLSPLVASKPNLMDTRFLRASSLPSDSGVDGDFGTENGSFVAADAALELFERDEEVFTAETAFIIPNQIEKDQANVVRHSWMASENLQDITRPSWLTSCADDQSSRVSIGAFLRAKTEDLGTLSDVTLAHHFDSASPPKHFDPLSVTNMIEMENTCNASTDSILSSISRLVGEASFSGEASALMANIMKMANERKAARATNERLASSVRADPSGASEASGNLEAAKRVDDWVILRSVKHADELTRAPLVETPIPACDSTQLEQHAVEQRPRSEDFLSVTPIALHLLRANSIGRRPSLDVPTNLIFLEPCVTGATIAQCLPLQNPSTLWLEGSTELLVLTCDGQPVHPSNSAFTFDASWTVEPAVDKLMTVKFCPQSVGKWTAKVRIACRQVCSSDWHTVSFVSLEAVAERPHVDVHPAGIMDFGRLPEESHCLRTLSISTPCKAIVPIRLVIERESRLGQGFYFAADNQPSGLSSKEMVGPSEIVCALHGSKSFVIHLKTPSISEHEDNVQVLRTNLRVDLDCSGSVVTLTTMLLRAVFGVLRLYTPQDIEPIPLQPSYDYPLQNRGPVPVHVELCTRHPDRVSVAPSALFLEPGQRNFVRIAYHPLKNSESQLRSVLQLKVQPDGPSYEMHLLGLNQISAAPSPQLPQLLNSDRRNVLFSTVPIGQISEKTVTLHNASTTSSLNINLCVLINNNNMSSIPAHPPPFHLFLTSASTGLRSNRLTNVSLMPNERLSVVVCYTPTTVCLDSALLVIKPNESPSFVGKKIKFTMPLVGYGGSSNVTWDGVDESQMAANDCDWVVNKKTANGEFLLTARNRGLRPAFVKILPSHDPTLTSVTTSSSPPLSVRPSHFVLLPSDHQHVRVTVDLSRSSTPTFYLGLFFGDDILRQRFRLYCRSSALRNCDTALEQLESLLLRDRFLGEVPLVDTDASHQRPPPSRSDYQFLVANMRTKWVAILPSLFVGSASVFQEEASRIFLPLVPEQTFSETPVLSNMSGPVSPPTRDYYNPLKFLKVDNTVLSFPNTKCESSSVLKVVIRNSSYENEKVDVFAPSAPFSVSYTTLTLKPRHYLSLPVNFRPQHVGSYSSTLHLRTVDNASIAICLSGEAIRS